MSIVHDVFESVKQRDPDQPEFHQAVWEVLESLEPVLEKHLTTATSSSASQSQSA